MEKFLEIVTLANGKANDFVWGPIMLALLVGTGVFLTFRTGWLQVRRPDKRPSAGPAFPPGPSHCL